MRYLSVILLLLMACQTQHSKIYIATCRKQQSYIDVLGVNNKTILMYIDDTAKIQFQHLDKPQAYNIYFKCEDTLARLSNRIYRALQKQPNLYECGYKDIIKDCLRHPKDTTYTWSTIVYTTVVIPNSIEDEISSIDLMISDSMYNKLFDETAFILVTANKTTYYCDCAIAGYLILKPEPRYVIKEITIKHYRHLMSNR